MAYQYLNQSGLPINLDFTDSRRRKGVCEVKMVFFFGKFIFKINPDFRNSYKESEIENISEPQVVDSSVVYGVLPGEIGSALDGNRTCNLRFRRPMLYPVELQVQHFQ